MIIKSPQMKRLFIVTITNLNGLEKTLKNWSFGLNKMGSGQKLFLL